MDSCNPTCSNSQEMKLTLSTWSNASVSPSSITSLLYKSIIARFETFTNIYARLYVLVLNIRVICIPAVHIISFCVSFLSRSRVDEINWRPAPSVMVFIAQGGRALQRERRGHGIESL